MTRDRSRKNVTAVPVDHNDEKISTITEFKPATKRKSSILKRILNFFLCRRKRSRQAFDTDVKPVSLLGLFRYATRFENFLAVVGTLSALLTGVLVPSSMIACGSVDSNLLQIPPESPYFRESFKYVYIVLSLGVLSFIFSYLAFLCFQTVCCHIIAEMRHQYLRAIVRQNAEWFDRNHCGILTTRLNDNIDRIREGIGEKLGFLLKGGGMYVAAVIISFVYEWRLGLFMFILSPCTTFLMMKLSQKLDEATENELKGIGQAGAIAEESILGVRTVQSCNAQETMVQRYATELRNGKLYGIQKALWSGSLGGLFYFILFVFLGTGLLYGGYLMNVGIFKKPGDLFCVIFATLVGSYFLGVVSPHLMVLLNARAAAATIYQVIDRKPEIDVYSKKGKIIQNLEGRVAFKNVHFRYPSRKDVRVLNGLNLEIEAGQVVALVGHSGCGKTTSVGLLTRLYEAEMGHVTIDDNDVRDLNIEWLRNVIGVVQQEPIIFNDTVEENLKLGNPDADINLLVKVCRMANAHNFIMKLPKGYQTLIGDGGVQLSGGQKQRIAIARTLARNPKILLLDEATSALDVHSEAIVQNALNKASKGRTTIMIAHRLSTIRNADKIVVFDKGTIVEQGTHNELVQANGAYAQLVKAQQFEVEDEVDTLIQEETDKIELIDDFYPTQERRCRRTSSNYSHGSNAFVRAYRQSDRQSRSNIRLSLNVDNYQPQSTFTSPSACDNEDEEHEGGGILSIYKNAKGNYWKLIGGLISGIVCGLHMPGNTLIFGYVFKAFSTNVSDNLLIQKLAIAMAMYVGTGLVVLLTEFCGTTLFGMLSENLMLRFRVRALRSIMLQDAAYFDKPQHSPGRLITHLAADAPKIKAVIDSRMFHISFGLTGMIVNFIVGFVQCWQVAACGASLVILYALLQIYLAMHIRKTNKKLLKEDNAGKLSVEIIENVRTIQLLTREEIFNERYEKSLITWKKAEMSKTYVEALNFTVAQSFQFFIISCSYSIIIHCASIGLVPVVGSFNAHVAMLLASFSVLLFAPYFPEIVEAHSAAKSLFKIIDCKPKTGDHKEGITLMMKGRLCFENVNFAYPQRLTHPVMQNMNFEAKPGQTIALVGQSGCGKSTAVSLIERFYDVNTGSILIDGINLKTISLHYLRTQIALVGQEPRLFAGSIRENICLGLDDDVPFEKLNEALELANAKSFINSLPKGLDTEVGEKGTQLSGGQKQRIAIARAIIRNPKILLLDEATSALDSEAEKAVQEALDKARQGRTCLTIAHRLSSIQNADLILYIDNGNVCEMGTHSTLMARRGHYYSMIKRQNLTS